MYSSRNKRRVKEVGAVNLLELGVAIQESDFRFITKFDQKIVAVVVIEQYTRNADAHSVWEVSVRKVGKDEDLQRCLQFQSG